MILCAQKVLFSVKWNILWLIKESDNKSVMLQFNKIRSNNLTTMTVNFIVRIDKWFVYTIARYHFLGLELPATEEGYKL